MIKHITTGKAVDGVHITQLRPLISESATKEWIFEKDRFSKITMMLRRY
jgi:hypothetical protein